MLVVLRQIGTGMGSSIPVEQALFPVLRFRDGLVWRFDVYFARERGEAALVVE